MPKIKIYLDDGETIEEAKESLEKALKAEENIDHKPDDPIMESIYNKLEALHISTMNQILDDIDQILEDETK